MNTESSVDEDCDVTKPISYIPPLERQNNSVPYHSIAYCFCLSTILLPFMPNLVIAAIRGSLGNVNAVSRSNKNIRFRTAGLVSIALLSVSTMSTTTAAMATEVAPSVPTRMHLTDAMKNSADWLSKASLIPIDFAPGIGDTVTEKTSETLNGSDAVTQNAGLAGSICFVVRRPG